MSDHEWLKALKSGDRVLVSGRTHKTLAVVDHLTTQHVVIHTGSKFRLRDGISTYSDGISRDHLVQATPETLAKFNRLREHRKLMNRFRGIDPERLTTDQLQAIIKVIEGV